MLDNSVGIQNSDIKDVKDLVVVLKGIETADKCKFVIDALGENIFNIITNGSELATVMKTMNSYDSNIHLFNKLKDTIHKFIIEKNDLSSIKEKLSVHQSNILNKFYNLRSISYLKTNDLTFWSKQVKYGGTKVYQDDQTYYVPNRIAKVIKYINNTNNLHQEPENFMDNIRYLLSKKSFAFFGITRNNDTDSVIFSKDNEMSEIKSRSSFLKN